MDLLTPNEVAKLLRVSLRSVYRWIRRGQIGFLEREAGSGVRYLIPRSAALAKLRRKPVVQPTVAEFETYPALEKFGAL